jgi:hypothetical protein
VSSPSQAVPVAIVVAGALIGGGLFFGLRASRPEIPTTATSQSPPPPPAPVASRDKVLADVNAALEEQRARVVADCWQPAVKVKPEPPTMQVVYTYTFTAQGMQMARGIGVDRATSRPDVVTCLSTAVHPLTIPPPGAPVTVDVTFRLP